MEPVPFIVTAALIGSENSSQGCDVEIFAVQTKWNSEGIDFEAMPPLWLLQETHLPTIERKNTPTATPILRFLCVLGRSTFYKLYEYIYAVKLCRAERINGCRSQ